MAGDRETVFSHGREHRDTAKREKERKSEQRETKTEQEKRRGIEREREKEVREQTQAQAPTGIEISFPTQPLPPDTPPWDGEFLIPSTRS